MSEYLTVVEAREFKLSINPFKRQRQVGEQIAGLHISSWGSSSVFMLGREDLVNAAVQRQQIDDVTAQLHDQPQQIQVFNIG